MSNETPEAGKVYAVKGFTFRVDFVENGQVYYVRFRDGEEQGRRGRVTLAIWRRDMRDAMLDETAEVMG
jgi:hypothetical protein